MTRLLIVADNPLLLTTIYPMLAPAGYAVIETTTNPSTALRMLRHTSYQYTALAQIDARSSTGYLFVDLLELDHEVRSQHAFVLFTSLPAFCLPPATLRLGYKLLSLPFQSKDLLDALHRPLIARPRRPSVPLSPQDSDIVVHRQDTYRQAPHTEYHIAQRPIPDGGFEHNSAWTTTPLLENMAE